MEYLIAFQLLCGCFAAFVAGRRSRSRAAWWFVGALLPVAGVVLALTASHPGAAGSSGPAHSASEPRKPAGRPRRCCGSYIPDCLGCPYFRRPLFDGEGSSQKKGTCTLLGTDLTLEPQPRGSSVTVDET
jgi:hypothetical protein